MVIASALPLAAVLLFVPVSFMFGAATFIGVDHLLASRRASYRPTDWFESTRWSSRLLPPGSQGSLPRRVFIRLCVSWARLLFTAASAFLLLCLAWAVKALFA